jgi:plasmid maintenance system killer protein
MMRFSFSNRFLRQYAEAPAEVRNAFDKQSRWLSAGLAHPSFRAKKYDETNGIWQARVNRDWRFYFTLAGAECRLLEIRRHPK